MTEQQAFLANIEENRVRNATTPMDDAYNIQRLINVYQMTEDQAADSYRASVSWIKGRLQLLELTPEAEKAVRSGRVAPSAAKAIAKLSKEHQKAVVAKQGKITTADVKREAPAKPKLEAVPVAIHPKVRKAITVLLSECDQQPDVMVFEVHRDTIRALRAAVKGESV